MKNWVIRVEGPDFVADLFISDYLVVNAEPRLAFTIGQDWSDVQRDLLDRGWSIETVTPPPPRRAPARRGRSRS